MVGGREIGRELVLVKTERVEPRGEVAAYRAPGSPMSTFATESLMDELARRLHKDPIELRLQNAVGSVERVEDRDFFSEAVVKPAVDFARLDQVFIVLSDRKGGAK